MGQVVSLCTLIRHNLKHLLVSDKSMAFMEKRLNLYIIVVLGCFPKVRTGRLDRDLTSHFHNEISFFKELIMKNHLLCAYYLGFD